MTVKSEYHKGVLCIEAGWLYREAGIMTEYTYKNMVARKQLNVIRRGCLGRPALVAFDSMPDRFKAAILKIDDPRTKVAVNVIEGFIRPDRAAADTFEQYTLPGGVHLKPEKQQTYYANAIVLNALRDAVEDTRGTQRALGGRTNFWKNLATAVSQLDREKYPHNLPREERRLREKLNDYLKNGYEGLIHKNFNNKCAAKVDDDIKESMLMELIADPRNMDDAQIARLYNMIAEKMDWKKITPAAVSVWRNKYELESAPGRRGLTHHRNQKTMQVKRIKPAYPLYYWTMDGWDAELLYQQTTIDKKGNSVTTYHNRLTLVVVLDPCINYPIGFAIGTHETPELITEALRNAANHTAELFGQRHRTHQLQSDHYAIKSLTPVYEMMAKHFTPAQVKNAKAKVVEPYFKYLNKTYCQFMPNWSGFGATARKENQPNVDF